jgi:glycine/D-amino acid oxidase-like deaminating enzyme
MTLHSKDLPVLVAGGGIGGLAAALALTRRGFRVTVLEQSPEIGEIGAGIQLGPNAFHAFDALGVGPKARGRAVYTDYMVMHDALDETQIGKIPTGEAFRKRFGNPYAVIHRVDVHLSLLEGAQETGRVAFHTSTRVEQIEQTADTVTVTCGNGKQFTGQALIGADGVRSVVRAQYVNDPPRVTGHVVYRAVVDKKDFPENLQWNAASIWVGPNCHLVHYPLRGGRGSMAGCFSTFSCARIGLPAATLPTSGRPNSLAASRSACTASFTRMPREVPATSSIRPLRASACRCCSAAFSERKPNARAISSRVGGAPCSTSACWMNSRISPWRRVSGAGVSVAAIMSLRAGIDCKFIRGILLAPARR